MGPRTQVRHKVPNVGGTATDRVKHRTLRVRGPGGPPAVAGAGPAVREDDVAVVEVADTYLTRLRGMLARRTLPQGLLLLPGGSVHGVGMTRRLEVAMLAPHDGAEPGTGPYRVVRTAVLLPFGLLASRRGVRAVLEAPVGSFERWGVVPGATVSFVPERSPALGTTGQ